MNAAVRWSIKCKMCGADLGSLENRAASICLRVRGDEETRSYFLCKDCDVYTVWVCIEDFFTDDEILFAMGPILREQGDKIVEQIRKCPAPDSMSCRCPTHEELSCSGFG